MRSLSGSPFRSVIGLLMAVLVLAGACGSDAGALSVEQAWARTSPPGAANAALYMTLEASDGATIVGASVDGAIAARAELHETLIGSAAMTDDSEMDAGEMESGEMEDGDGGHGDGHDNNAMAGGVMSMVSVEQIEVPVDGSVELTPGGLHIMLFDIVEPLATGDEFAVVLELDDGEEITVDIEVREDSP